MPERNVNVDLCGIRKLLRLLVGHGFTEADVKKLTAMIAREMGADIIIC